MSDRVIDTNIWVMVDKSPADCETVAEIECAKFCRKWLQAFVEGDDKLVVDLTYRILREYRTEIKRYAPQGLARQLLNRLETKPRDRKLVELTIGYDSDGYALLPDELMIHDREDRKSIAVALAHTPTPPICNATDTDWGKEKDRLQAGGIIVEELCPDYVTDKLK